MEHSKKYALVPVDRIQQFEDEHLSELDLQIRNILKKKIEEDEKAKLYIQALQKYVTFPNVNNVKPFIEKQPEQQISEDTIKIENQILKNIPVKNKSIAHNTLDIENKILESVPVKYNSIAQNILDFLKKHKISWSERKEVLIDNKILPGSDIIQLVNFLLRNKARKPAAFEEFNEHLTINSFPSDFIKNNYLTNLKTMYAKPKVKRLVPTKKWLKLY